MITSTFQALLFKSMVILNAQHPASFGLKSSEIWISDPDHVEARISQSTNGSSVQIRSLSPNTSFFASGISHPGWTLVDPQKFVVTTDENFKALRKCPHVNLQILTDGRLEWIAEQGEWDSQGAQCGFDDLLVGENARWRQSSLWQEQEALLLQQGFQILRSRWVDRKKEILIKGISSQQSRIKKILGPLSAFYSLQFRENQATPGRTVQFQLTLFEVSRSRALKLGMNWPKQISYKELLESNRVANGLVADFAENLGIGKVLAQPTLRTLPGEKVSFQSGGEFPIEIKTEKELSTVFKNYGLILEITPQKDLIPGESEISIEFKAELSEPDFGLSAGKSPGLTKRFLSSRFDLRMEETTVLGSMFQSRSSASRSGLPGLLEWPVISWIFSSKDRNTNDSDLWFGIRPSWIDLAQLPDLDVQNESIQNL